MFRISIIVGKIVMSFLHLIGRGGSALPGLVVERVNANYLKDLRAVLPKGVLMVTGSNGKTTTTKVIAAIFESTGLAVLTNKTGSNFRRGIIAASLEDATWTGRIKKDIAILEVDEGHAPLLAKMLRPKLLVALNVFRDQLDRYGELDTTASKIEQAAKYAQEIIVNSDDPSLAPLLASQYAAKAKSFGATPEIQKLLPHDGALHQSTFKPIDNNPQTLLEKIAPSDDNLIITIKQGDQRFNFETKLTGAHNAINLTAVIAVCEAAHLDINESIKTISRTDPAFGRGEIINWHGHEVNLQLVKNPAGFNQVITSLNSTKVGCLVVAINDQIADGRDVSWLWDVSIAKIKKWHHKPDSIIATGSRAYDMALRFKYDNMTYSSEININSVFSDLEPGTGNITVIATYTSMLEIRRLLVRESNAKEFWK